MIVIGSNEARHVVAAFAMQRIPYNIEPLITDAGDMGDFSNTVRDFYIERKVAWGASNENTDHFVNKDLWASMTDGRLLSQAARLHDNFTGYRGMIVEGDLEKFLRVNPGRRNFVESTLVILSVQFGIHLLFSTNVQMTARLVKWIDAKIGHPPPEPKQKLMKNVDKRVGSLMSLVKGLGEKRAIALLNEYGSVHEIAHQVAKSVAKKVDGVGRTLATNVIEGLNRGHVAEHTSGDEELPESMRVE
jgi:ERCC4-type nuclease